MGGEWEGPSVAMYIHVCMYFFPGLFNIHFFRKVFVDDVLVWSFGDTVKTTATDTYSTGHVELIRERRVRAIVLASLKV